MGLKVYEWAAKQTAGSTMAKSVLLSLAIFANDETLKCCPSQSSIAKVLEVKTLESIRRALRTLEDAGLIKRTFYKTAAKNLATSYEFPNYKHRSSATTPQEHSSPIKNGAPYKIGVPYEKGGPLQNRGRVPYKTGGGSPTKPPLKEVKRNEKKIYTVDAAAPTSLPTFPANSSVAGITDADSKTNVIAFENREEKVIGKKVAGVAASTVIPLTNHQTNLVSTVAADTDYFLAPEAIPPKEKTVPVKKVRARRTPVPFSKAGITALPLEWKQKAEMKCSAEGVRISLESLFVDFSTCYQPGGRNERITRVNWIETWLAWVSNAIERQKRRPQVPQEEEVRYSKMGNKYRDSDFRVPDDQQKDWS